VGSEVTEYTPYTITNQVLLEDTGKALEVDGVEIITRKEREAMQASVQRMINAMNREVEDAIMYGDGPRPKLLK
jgi:hypothetical protein